MRKTTIFLFILSSTLAVYNPYEDASSSDYQELFSEIRSFVREVLFANLKRKEKVRFRPATTSCLNRCGEERSRTFYCHCDENCQLTQDCCYDYLKICKPNTTISQGEREKWQCISDLHHQHLNYLPWYDMHVNLPRIRGHMMISSCLNCSRELQENCSNPDSDIDAGKIPVEGPDGHTYRNRFCALGNGIKPENIKSWGYELICSEVGAYNETEKIRGIASSCIKNESQNCLAQDKAYLQNNCTWHYARAPSLNITKYHTVCSPVKTCPPTPAINMTALKYAELRLKCHAYMRVVYHNGNFYKNFHCALCYGIGPTELQNPPSIAHIPTISIFFEIPQNKPNRYKEANIKYATNRTAATVNNGSNSFETTEFKLEMYFNLVGLSISMVTLLLLLALYSLVKELRTTPGKIIIGLSTSILIYQTVLLVSPQFTENAVACSITAIILHFAILSSFAWMSIMSFDVWKTFGRNNQQRMRKNSSSFLYYCFYVFINPFIIVLTAIALDRSGVMLVYWRDGESNSCWIVDNLSNILFFKVPVGISLGLNVIAFIWTILGITSVRNKTIKYNSTKNQQATVTKDVKMYGKLSVVMGLTWTLGFATEYSVIVKFIFLIVNSLQGFFIFLAFVTNKRVVEKCKVSRPSWSQSGGSNTRKISSGSSTGLNTRKISYGSSTGLNTRKISSGSSTGLNTRKISSGSSTGLNTRKISSGSSTGLNTRKISSGSSTGLN